MHIYVDESKAKAYIVVAVIVPPGLAAGFRKRMRSLRMPGQGHIHFVSERDSRRKWILGRLAEMNVTDRVYRVAGLNPIAARALCLGALMDDFQEIGASAVTIELEESARSSDEQILRQGLLSRGLKSAVAYTHVGKSDEPILWIADAIAWSFARGDDYKRRVTPLIEMVREISA